MRIVSQLVGRNNNGCESAMMLRIIVHHGLNAARGKHATRRARLAAHHQYDRQRRLVFGCDKRCRRQIYQRLSRFEAARKGADLLVVNRVDWDQGFESAENAVLVLDAAGEVVAEASGTKRAVAATVAHRSEGSCSTQPDCG